MHRESIRIRGLIEGGEVEHTFEECRLVLRRHQVTDFGTWLPDFEGRGVTLQGLFEMNRPLSSATHVILEKADSTVTYALSMEEARKAVVVYERDGQSLAPADGGPFFVILSGPTQPLMVAQVASIHVAKGPA